MRFDPENDPDGKMPTSKDWKRAESWAARSEDPGGHPSANPEMYSVFGHLKDLEAFGDEPDLGGLRGKKRVLDRLDEELEDWDARRKSLNLKPHGFSVEVARSVEAEQATVVAAMRQARDAPGRESRHEADHAE